MTSTVSFKIKVHGRERWKHFLQRLVALKGLDKDGRVAGAMDV
jgi:hypothetical protein